MSTVVEEERVVFARARDRDYTEKEYYKLNGDYHAAEARGDEAEMDRLLRLIPISPTVVKAFAKTYGKDFIIESGFDLTEANIAYGEGWLDAIE